MKRKSKGHRCFSPRVVVVVGWGPRRPDGARCLCNKGSNSNVNHRAMKRADGHLLLDEHLFTAPFILLVIRQ